MSFVTNLIYLIKDHQANYTRYISFGPTFQVQGTTTSCNQPHQDNHVVQPYNLDNKAMIFILGERKNVDDKGTDDYSQSEISRKSVGSSAKTLVTSLCQLMTLAIARFCIPYKT